MARKPQPYDWSRKYHKKCWEGIKKIQKLLRQFPELKDLSLSESSGKLHIKGKSLKELHEIRTFLKARIPWEDKIEGKYPTNEYLSVHYEGQKDYDFITIVIKFPYSNLPEGILGDCYIKEDKMEIEAYTSVSKTIVCPIREV